MFNWTFVFNYMQELSLRGVALNRTAVMKDTPHHFLYRESDDLQYFTILLLKSFALRIYSLDSKSLYFSAGTTSG